MTIRKIITEAQNLLSGELGLSNADAKREARLLLQTALNVNRAWLLSHENDALGSNIHAAFGALLKRRINGEPIAYILGKREFYGLEFMVTPDTLIPRPDTETLVEAALGKIPLISSFPRKRESSNLIGLDSGPRRNDELSVLDLGTGTGAIAIAIATQRPHAQVTAVDAFPAALDVANANAKNLNVNNVHFVLSDWFSALAGQTFDVIVSNPPYIAEDDLHLKQGDLRFEPMSALAAGKDGLDCIRHIISHAGLHLNPHGWLMLEHGYDQAEKVAQLLKKENFEAVSSMPDLSGILRVTWGKKN